MRKSFVYVGVVVVLVVLTACGGGTTGPSPLPTPTPSATPTPAPARRVLRNFNECAGVYGVPGCENNSGFGYGVRTDVVGTLDASISWTPTEGYVALYVCSGAAYEGDCLGSGREVAVSRDPAEHPKQVVARVNPGEYVIRVRNLGTPGRNVQVQVSGQIGFTPE